MLGLLLRLLSGRVIHKAVAKRAGSGGAFDIRFGFALLRDRRVPLRARLLTVGLGAGLIAGLLALELPMEGLWALLLPIIGIPFISIDGLEVLLGPLIVSALLLPYLAPKALVEQIRQERLGLIGEGTIINVEHRAPTESRPARKWRLAR